MADRNDLRKAHFAKPLTLRSVSPAEQGGFGEQSHSCLGSQEAERESAPDSCILPMTLNQGLLYLGLVFIFLYIRG